MDTREQGVAVLQNGVRSREVVVREGVVVRRLAEMEMEMELVREGAGREPM
jgi:hypothetical protein